MTIMLKDPSVYDHGFWWLMIDHENGWSIIFDHQWNADIVLSEVVDIY